MAASSSDSEDDEIDASKLAALRSVAIDSSAVIQNASAPVASRRKSANSGKSGNGSADVHGSDDDEGKDSSGLKLYQTRLQDLLYKHLDKTFGATAGGPSVAPAKNQHSLNKDDVVDGGQQTGGIRLFRRAPPGIIEQPREERILGPGTKPQLRPSLTLDEDSEEHIVRLQAAVVDNETVSEQAKRLREKVLASAKSSQAKVELARKNEEERVAKLKRERGEEWLPSVAFQLAKETANEPKLPTKVAPTAVQVPEDTNTEVPLKKKKRKKKVSKAQLGVFLD
ncbi:hypothetical protein M758_9G063100 [Ceratodon purpureus]|nr:hypothetical protein M758_9G063100 [Ceratodon purpureus]